MSNKLFFYTLSQDYCRYLKFFDRRVPHIHAGKEKRPFVGIVLKVNNVDFYAPLSSPKPKHLSMKNNIDFTKIASGVLGAINFNNMIPIPLNSLTKINPKVTSKMDSDEIKYNLMLQNQLSWCNSNKSKIIDKAQRLYDNYKACNLNHDVIDRCCDFSILEEKCELWKKYPNLVNSILYNNTLKELNDHIRHKDTGYSTSMLEGKHFIYNNDLYRIDQITLKPLGSDTAILTKLNISGEEKFVDNNFTSDAKFNLHLQKIDSKSLSNFKDNKNK